MKLQKAWQTLVQWIKNPKNLIFVLGMVFITTGMFSSHFSTTYNSDDVIWQNALFDWIPFSGDVFFGNSDVAFILQAPLYWLVSLFIEPGRPAMLASGILLSLITFAAFYWSALYFFRIIKVKVTYLSLLPLLWVSTFGFYLDRIFLGTNLHNLVVALIFVFLVIISKICRNEFKFKKQSSLVLGAIGLVLFIALSVVNDRYFVFFGIAPAIGLIGIYAIRKLITRQKAIRLLAIIAAGFIASKIIGYSLTAVGIVLSTGVGHAEFVASENILTNIMNTIHTYLLIMGGDIFGKSPISIVTIAAMINFVLAAFAIYASIKFTKISKIAPEILMLVGIFGLNITAYTFSNLSMGIEDTYRYLIILPYVIAIIVSVYISKHITKQKQFIFKLILIVAILLNIGISFIGGLGISNRLTEKAGLTLPSNAQSINYDLINTVKGAGFTKGYSPYWSANINTYLSKDSVRFLPVICSTSGQSLPVQWFINKDWFLKKSNTSFYIVEKFHANPTCTPEQVKAQFGEPTNIIEFNDKITIYTYGYDLIDKIDVTNLNKY